MYHDRTAHDLPPLVPGQNVHILDMYIDWISASRVQILDETDCISHSTNTLGKGMNPIILLPAMDK